MVGVATAVDTVGEAVARAFAEAGVDSVAHVSACLANADLPVEEEQLAAALHARAWGTSVEVRNDTFAILRAGIAEPRGVAVVCGAGINCVGMRTDGRTARFPALGRISGDWGGGWGLAEEALWYAARAEDGRGGPTALAHTLPAHFGLSSMYALIEALHLEHIEHDRRHELTPVLFATAAEGDEVARARGPARGRGRRDGHGRSDPPRPPHRGDPVLLGVVSLPPAIPNSTTGSANSCRPRPPRRSPGDLVPPRAGRRPPGPGPRPRPHRGPHPCTGLLRGG